MGRSSTSKNKGAVAASRSSDRARKSTELFNISVEEKRTRVKKSSTRGAAISKKAAKSKKGSGKKSGTKRRSRKRSESSDEEEDETDYEIKDIVDHRIYDDHYIEYAVTWVGYPDEKTWMTEYDLKDAPKVLADYKFKVTKKTDNPGEDYTVQEILAHRDVGKKRYYLVHWKGFDHPVSHTEMEEKELKDAKDVLETYKASLKNEKKGVKRRAPSKSSSKKKSNGKVESDDEEEEEEEVEQAEEEEVETATEEVQEDSDDDEEEEEEEEESPKRKRQRSEE
ncbi:unnamed protein product [Caenorhabditis angaria]|uniref:Chromo domain-containing protein n=1 Tax=Caenorhabditis angaria TaxID=860376 RepID=A0A9P1IP42_9PELO|nr:unnamed protein product [Caenorhabditis angaria]